VPQVLYVDTHWVSALQAFDSREKMSITPHLSPHPEVGLNLGQAVVAASTAPLLLLDVDLNVVAASASFCSRFQIDQAKTPNCQLAKLGAGELGFAEVDGYEMDLTRAGRPTRRLVVNAKKLNYSEGDGVRLIFSVADITDARIAEKLKDDLVREKEILLQELHHRVANSLQIVASVIMQSARKVQSDEVRSHLNDAHHRIMSVASLQKQLAISRPGDSELRPYLVALCESIGASMIRDHNQLSLEVQADESVATADVSVSLGLIVTELIINALKHAFPDNRSGKITVHYHSQGPNWTLSVGDNGIGMPINPAHAKAGLGTSIVQSLAKHLSAKINVADANPGTKISVVHTYVPVLVGQTAAPADRAV
jgi:two-component sensor histidine kinase